MSKVVLKGYVIIPDGDLNAVMAELPLHIEATKNEDGCLVFNVAQDENDTCKLTVYEEFFDDVAFRLHQERVQQSKWGELTKNCERNYQIVNIS